jgi:2-iminobutanoate/2-iminopropanoate deaminase
VSAPITPVVVHNGLIYVSGQGANDNGSTDELEITSHVHRAMDNIKRLVEAAGGDMDHVLELTVFLSTLEFYQAMNKAYGLTSRIGRRPGVRFQLPAFRATHWSK